MAHKIDIILSISDMQLSDVFKEIKGSQAENKLRRYILIDDFKSSCKKYNPPCLIKNDGSEGD